MKASQLLALHLADLSRSTGVGGSIREVEKRFYIQLSAVTLPPGVFCVDTTDVLFIADPQYPLSALDMFWTDPGVLRVDGSDPRGAKWIETYLGRSWRRFSWHDETWRNQDAWRPTGNPLLGHFAMMEARFAAERGEVGVA